MAKKATAKSRPRTGAKATKAARSKDATPAPTKKPGFGKRSKTSVAAHAASPSTAASKSTTTKPARKSTVGKAVNDVVGAVSATVSNLAGQATSLFKRGRTKKTR